MHRQCRKLMVGGVGGVGERLDSNSRVRPGQMVQLRSSRDEARKGRTSREEEVF